MNAGIFTAPRGKIDEKIEGGNDRRSVLIDC
jgi:hypothetical protein